MVTGGRWSTALAPRGGHRASAEAGRGVDQRRCGRDAGCARGSGWWPGWGARRLGGDDCCQADWTRRLRPWVVNLAGRHVCEQAGMTFSAWRVETIAGVDGDGRVGGSRLFRRMRPARGWVGSLDLARLGLPQPPPDRISAGTSAPASLTAFLPAHRPQVPAILSRIWSWIVYGSRGASVSPLFAPRQ